MKRKGMQISSTNYRKKIRQVEMKKIAIAYITLSMFLLACARTSNYRESSFEEIEKSKKIMDGKARADSATQIKVKPNINNKPLIKPSGEKENG